MLLLKHKESFKAKIDVTTYSGKLDGDKLVEWIDALNNYFEYKEVVKHMKVKIFKTKFKGSTLVWWSYSQLERVKVRKKMIISRSRMVSLIKAKFMLANYEIQAIKSLQNLKQKDLDAASYTEKFHKLSLKAKH